jgi:cysteinyl-tRNA synthetase
MIKTHYRSPLNFNQELLMDAKNNLTRLYTAIKDYKGNSLNNGGINKGNKIGNVATKDINWKNTYAQKFKLAMDDDFNTSLALSIIFELMGEVNKSKNLELMELIVSLGNILGILYRSPKDYFQSVNGLLLDDKGVEGIEELIIQRNTARKNKDFALSDQVRDKLLAQGIVLEDTDAGTVWRKV